MESTNNIAVIFFIVLKINEMVVYVILTAVLSTPLRLSISERNEQCQRALVSVRRT